MKKRFLGGTLALALAFGSISALSSTNEAEARNLPTQSISGIGSVKGDLYGNAEGTRFCCKASDYKECSAKACP